MKVGLVAAVVNRIFNNIPFGLVSLCTVLKQNGVPCNIVDFYDLNHRKIISDDDFSQANIKVFGEYILAQEYTVLSFYTMANSYHISISLAEYIREKNSNIIIIFAGPQASECAEDTLTAFSFIDMVAIGEGENTIMKLLECIKANDYSNCPNLVYRNEKGRIIHNKHIPLINDLDSLPYLDYSFVPYMDTFTEIPVEIGRGCPFACKFCSTKSFWQRNYRLKSNERIIEELRGLIEKHGREKLYDLNHDSLTANRKRIMSFCKALEESGINIKWKCSTRIDVLDEEIICALKRSGCSRVFMGIESGSNRIQSFINKNIDTAKIIPTIKLLLHYGIRPTCSFIYGFPTETKEELIETLNIVYHLKKMGLIDTQLHRLTYLRGTEFYEQYKDEVTILDDLLFSNFITGGNSRKFIEMISKYPKLFVSFYSRPLEVTDADYIEPFTSFYLTFLIARHPLTLKLIERQFQGNILGFYYDIRKEVADSYSTLRMYYDNLVVTNELILPLESAMCAYFKRKSRDNFNLLYSLFLFEVDYNKWFYGEKRLTKNVYCYDFVSFIKNNLIPNDIYKKETEIIFMWNNEKPYIFRAFDSSTGQNTM